MKFSQLFVIFSALSSSAVAGKSGKGGKKGDSMDDDGLSGEYYDSCVFANPALDKKYLQVAGGAPDIPFLLEHAQIQMGIFQECIEIVLFGVDSGELTEEEALLTVFIKGYLVGGVHAGLEGEHHEWEPQVCNDFGAMVLAMANSCYFEENAGIYVIISYLLHEGFYTALNDESGSEYTLEEGCVWFDEWLADDWGDDDDDDDDDYDYRRGLGQGEEKKPSLKESTKKKLLARLHAHQNGDRFDLGNWQELQKNIEPSKFGGGFA